MIESLCRLMHHYNEHNYTFVIESVYINVMKKIINQLIGLTNLKIPTPFPLSFERDDNMWGIFYTCLLKKIAGLLFYGGIYTTT